MFISKPIGHPIDEDTNFDDDLSLRNLVDENQQEVSNFARRLIQNQRAVASTPSSVNTQRSDEATQQVYTATSAVLNQPQQVAQDISGEGEVDEVELIQPAATSGKRGRGATLAAAEAANTQPLVFPLDKMIRYLPVSSIGLHAGPGYIINYTY